MLFLTDSLSTDRVQSSTLYPLLSTGVLLSEKVKVGYNTF